MGQRSWRVGRWWARLAPGLVVSCCAVLVICAAWVGWRVWSKYEVYARAREALAAEVSTLPMPPGSTVLARHDGMSTGQVEACVSLTAEILLGNDVPAADVYEFYKGDMAARGWSVALEMPRGVAMERGRMGFEASNNYYVSAVADHADIKGFESQYQSLAYIGFSYSVFGPEACEDAIRRFSERGGE